MVALTFVVLNAATVAAQSGILPTADDSAKPIVEGGESGGPAAQDMSGKMINDGGHGANSADKAAAEKVAAEEAAAREFAIEVAKMESCFEDWRPVNYKIAIGECDTPAFPSGAWGSDNLHTPAEWTALKDAFCSGGGKCND